jgi:hypothetical protein
MNAYASNDPNQATVTLEAFAAAPSVFAVGRTCVALLEGGPGLQDRRDMIVHPGGRSWLLRLIQRPRSLVEFTGAEGLRALAREARQYRHIKLYSFDLTLKPTVLAVVAANRDDLHEVMRKDPTFAELDLFGDAQDNEWVVTSAWNAECPSDLVACLQNLG